MVVYSDINSLFQPEKIEAYFNKYSPDMRAKYADRYLSSYSEMQNSLFMLRDQYRKLVDDSVSALKASEIFGEISFGGDLNRAETKAINSSFLLDDFTQKNLMVCETLRLKMTCIEYSLNYLPSYRIETGKELKISLEDLENRNSIILNDPTSGINHYQQILQSKYIFNMSLRSTAKTVGTSVTTLQKDIETALKYVYVPESLFGSVFSAF